MKKTILDFKNLLINLRNWTWGWKDYSLNQAEAEVVADALMRIIPKEVELVDPDTLDGKYKYRCPNEECGKVLPRNSCRDKFCPNCGQALIYKKVRS